MEAAAAGEIAVLAGDAVVELVLTAHADGKSSNPS
jgi:hypothetical protein